MPLSANMRFDGTQIQSDIYISGESPWPIACDEWEARARDILDDGPFGYIAGGAGSESTMAANLEAFRRRRQRVGTYWSPAGLGQLGHSTGHCRGNQHGSDYRWALCQWIQWKGD